MRAASLLPLLLIAACGKAPGHVDPVLVPYFSSFEANVASVGSVSGEFITLPGKTVGRCSVKDNISTVQVDPGYWEHASEEQKYMLVFHELGHCALELHHDTRMDSANPNCPISLMYPSIPPVACFEGNEGIYYQQLKGEQ